MKISRTWAIPNKWTFQIKPIAKLLTKYVGDGKGWIDPFAGENSPAEITNDINPEKPTKFHLHAKDFFNKIPGQYEGVLFDAPYSNRQIKECYEGIGLTVTQKDTQGLFCKEKKMFAGKIKTGGYGICFGWDSNGFGNYFGFEMIEILLVAHGGSHHDTIVTVERKVQYSLF